MSKMIELLLLENVENLGIVGDVVKVRAGYARNFLLPRGLATQPSEELVRSLAQRRAEAERQLAEQRKQREELIGRLTGLEITIQRACNNQGVLYGAVSQNDIAEALNTLGYGVRPRDVRIPSAIKRVDTYDVLIKFDTDLSTTVKVWVVADRKLELEEGRAEMEFDDEGNLIEQPPPAEAKEEGRAAGS